MIGIYKITSPTNKIYIGQSIDIDKRKEYYTKRRCQGQRRLFYSIQKHGWESHIFEVIEECEIENLNNRERYWQDFYNVLSENGLNCKLTQTWDKSGKTHPDSILKMSLSLKGGTPWSTGLTKETDQRLMYISQVITERNKNRIVSEHEIFIKQQTSPKNVAVLQYTKNGEFIKRFISMSEAKRELNLKTYTSISECCAGKRKSAYGFKWKYDETKC